MLDAATQVLLERGFVGFTGEGGAARAGIAKTTFDRPWPSRARLAVGVCEALAGAAAPGVPATNDLRTDLVTLIKGLAEGLAFAP